MLGPGGSDAFRQHTPFAFLLLLRVESAGFGDPRSPEPPRYSQAGDAQCPKVLLAQRSEADSSLGESGQGWPGGDFGCALKAEEGRDVFGQ